MQQTYRAFHGTKSSLANDVKTLTMEYNVRTITDDEMIGVISKWVESCPNLFLDQTQQPKLVIADSFKKMIGARRAAVINVCLAEIQKRNTK